MYIQDTEKLNVDTELVREEINVFLSDVNNYDYVVAGHFKPHYCSHVYEDFDITILSSEGGKALYEDCNLDFAKMCKFELELEAKYGLKPKYPSYYWGQ